MKVLITGFFGVNNLGDDLMLSNFCREILRLEPEIDITLALLFGDKKNIDVPEEINILDLTKFKRGKSIIFKLFVSKMYDAFFWIGGTIFTETTGNGAYRYMESFIDKHKIVGYIGVGIGNVLSKEKIEKYQYLVDSASIVTFRDVDSWKIGKKWSSNQNLYLCEDLVYLTDLSGFCKTQKEMKSVSSTERNAIVSWRSLSKYLSWDIESKAVNEVITWIKEHANVYDSWTICVLGDTVDEQINRYIYSKLCEISDLKDKINFVVDYDAMSRVNLIAKSDFAILGRLHGIFLAEVLNINTIAIGYDNKNERFLKSIGRTNDLIYPQNINSITLTRAHDSIYTEQIPFKEKKEQALMNCQILIQLLRGGYKIYILSLYSCIFSYGTL